VFLSSGGTVYGRPHRLPIDEAHPLAPIVPYGRSRKMAEHMVAKAAAADGLRATVLRLGNVYGDGQPSDRGQGVVAAFLTAVHNRAPAILYGDGSVARDYVHVHDVAGVVHGMLRLPQTPSVVNVASGSATTVLEVADVVRAVTGCPLILEHRPARSFDVERIQLDITRLSGLLDFAPLSLEQGVARTWNALSRPAARTGTHPSVITLPG
jgi:UDP-glucose 4-epimerase